MTERLSSWDPTDRGSCGVPAQESVHLFRQWGQSEIGLIVTGAIAVDADCMEAPGNPAIGPPISLPDLRLSRFADMAAAASTNGSLILGQLNHPGRQTPSDMQEQPISASDVAMLTNELGLRYNRPRPAGHRAIVRVIDQFLHGAKYLSNAGFDGIQINAAHGYLISQFLSPATNHRTDEYGGSVENRARLLLQIVRAIRQACPDDFVLSVKINCIEYGTSGLQIDDVLKICGWLQDAKVDMIELSGGTYEKFAWKHDDCTTDEPREGYFLQAADRIKPMLTKTRLYVTGGFRTRKAMTEARKTVDGIGLARALAQDPDICAKLLSGEVDEVTPTLFDPNDFKPSAAFAGAQMTRIAHGRRPMDASDSSTISNFFKNLQGRRHGHSSSERSGWLGSDLA